MNLDDLERMQAIDKDRMLSKIDELPDQLERAWDKSGALRLPDSSGLQHIVFAGMGGSAIGADLACSYVRRHASVGLTVWRDYGIPAWAAGPGALVVVSSHSGNTDEALASFDAAQRAGARRVAFTAGGDLQERAVQQGDPLWPIDHAGPPRAAVGYSFAYALRLLARLGQIPDPAGEVASAIAALRAQRERLGAVSPVVRNPAKRMAGQWIDRWPIFFGAGLLAPVARRWRSQVNELAKAPAQFEALPEADHNVVAGTLGPESLISRTMAVFLRASLDDPTLTRHVEATRHALMIEGYNTDLIDGEGDTRLAQQWTCLHYGDYAAFYLAIAYGVDPTPIAAIENLKQELRRGK